MNYFEQDKKIIVTDIESFDIEQILECGQCFRFEKIKDKHYIIIAHEKVLNIKQDNDKIEFFPTNKKDFENIWINYFDLKTNYKEIKKQLEKDPILKDAINFAPGIRILNQDPWECLISFIISQNNRIPMIKQVIKNISEKYGNNLNNYFSFPTISQLKVANNDDLMLCKTGFRSKYILDAINKIENKQVCLESLYSNSLEDSKQILMNIKGVGTKVADCVLLFSLKKSEVFPTDVWIKRVMEHFYFDKQETNIKTIHEFAKNKWQHLSGYAQQYLFYYARSQKIGTK